jgi:hypothetical protein
LKKIMILVLVIMTAVAAIPFALGQTGGLRINPTWSTMVASPANFTVWAQSADSYDVNVLLVTTEECFNQFADAPNVVATVDYPAGGYTIGFTKNAFNNVTTNSAKVPPNVTTSGVGYTVASLKDHLDYNLSTPLGSNDTIYWAIAPIVHADFDPLTTTPVNITVSEEGCPHPRMLVYLLGRSEDGADLFDMRIPPTEAGFVVPEIPVGSILAAATMFTALGLYAYKKRHTTK